MRHDRAQHCARSPTISRAARSAAGALQNLAISNDTNKNAVREAGAIAPLVVLLQAGAGSEAATSAAGALWNLVIANGINKNAIREAGAIAPLDAPRRRLRFGTRARGSA